MQLDVEETFLGMDTAVPLGIIINELVSNSLKHAFPQGRKGEIRIKLCKAEENVNNKSISNITNNIGAKSSVFGMVIFFTSGLAVLNIQSEDNRDKI